MSVRIETFLLCDGPCAQVWGNEDLHHMPAKNQRLLAQKSDGWVQRKSKDYCKDCAEKLGIKKRVTYSR